jgi:hypothetical protein
LVEKYAPPTQNNTAAYRAALAKALPGIKDKKISELNDKELQQVEEQIKKNDGFYQQGSVQYMPRKPMPPKSKSSHSSKGGCQEYSFAGGSGTCGGSFEVIE